MPFTPRAKHGALWHELVDTGRKSLYTKLRKRVLVVFVDSRIEILRNFHLFLLNFPMTKGGLIP
jgi:hypothetical protein